MKRATADQGERAQAEDNRTQLPEGHGRAVAKSAARTGQTCTRQPSSREGPAEWRARRLRRTRQRRRPAACSKGTGAMKLEQPALFEAARREAPRTARGTTSKATLAWHSRSRSKPSLRQSARGAASGSTILKLHRPTQRNFHLDRGRRRDKPQTRGWGSRTKQGRSAPPAQKPRRIPRRKKPPRREGGSTFQV